MSLKHNQMQCTRQSYIYSTSSTTVYSAGIYIQFLPSQVRPSTLSVYPVSQEQLYPSTVLVQVCSQSLIPSMHSSMSVECHMQQLQYKPFQGRSCSFSRNLEVCIPFSQCFPVHPVEQLQVSGRMHSPSFIHSPVQTAEKILPS